MKLKKNILAIGAHPDDIEIAAGGWLMYMRKHRAKVTVVTMTDGYTGGDPDERMKEAKDACAWAGFDHIQMGYIDGELKQSPETIDSLSRIIERVCPEMVLSHSVHDHHQDHVELSKTVFSAMRHVTCTHIEFSSWNKRIQAPWNFEFILKDIKKKRELLSFFKSQSERSYVKHVPPYERFNIRYMSI